MAGSEQFSEAALVNSVFLLFLSISGGFLGSTMGCDFQRHIEKNVAIKHVALIFFVFFTISFVSGSAPDPGGRLGYSVLVWIVYVLFTRQSFAFTTTSLALLMLVYINFTIVQYKIAQSERSRMPTWYHAITPETHQIIRTGLYAALAGTVVAGNAAYIAKKRRDYGPQFDLFTFYMGTTVCRSSTPQQPKP
jgi:hypothetical protein